MYWFPQPEATPRPVSSPREPETVQSTVLVDNLREVREQLSKELEASKRKRPASEVNEDRQEIKRLTSELDTCKRALRRKSRALKKLELELRQKEVQIRNQELTVRAAVEDSTTYRNRLRDTVNRVQNMVLDYESRVFRPVNQLFGVMEGWVRGELQRVHRTCEGELRALDYDLFDLGDLSYLDFVDFDDL